jgi:hypothetical protein
MSVHACTGLYTYTANQLQQRRNARHERVTGISTDIRLVAKPTLSWRQPRSTALQHPRVASNRRFALSLSQCWRKCSSDVLYVFFLCWEYDNVPTLGQCCSDIHSGGDVERHPLREHALHALRRYARPRAPAHTCAGRAPARPALVDSPCGSTCSPLLRPRARAHTTRPLTTRAPAARALTGHARVSDLPACTPNCLSSMWTLHPRTRNPLTRRAPADHPPHAHLHRPV